MFRDSRKIRFLIAGGLGFAVDAGVLAILTHAAGMRPLAARVVAIAVALTVTWLFNRHVTFGPGRHGAVGEAVRYGGIGIAGSLINYLIFASLMVAMPGLEPLIALGVASVVVTVFSWLGYSRFVFAR
jgi:putative flippase GtrA